MADENQDKQLGMDRSIARRDFLNGAAVAVGSSLAGGFLPGLEWIAEGAEQFAQDKPGYYPPTLTGMRGSHDGSFEAAHSERSEEHTSELQSRLHLVCRLLLEKKKHSPPNTSDSRP